MMQELGDYIVSSASKRLRYYKPRITINKYGIIFFNSSFCRKYIDIKKIKGVELYYFKKNNSIGFMFVYEKQTENSLKAHIYNKNNIKVSSNSFFTSINKEKKYLIGKYDPKKLNDIHYILLKDIKT
jgi:hypothetical protein